MAGSLSDHLKGLESEELLRIHAALQRLAATDDFRELETLVDVAAAQMENTVRGKPQRELADVNYYNGYSRGLRASVGIIEKVHNVARAVVRALEERDG